jgi:hypothetical protein
MLVGLLLAADDLVLRTPGVVGSAIVMAKQRSPQINWNFAAMPKLPSLPRFVTRDAVIAKTVKDTKVAKGKRGEEPVPATGKKAIVPSDPLAIIDPDDPLQQPILLSKKAGKDRRR